MSRKGPAPELQGVEVALAPEELELDPMAMTQKYEEHVREQQAQVEKEDFSDMVAEHAAKQKVGAHTRSRLGGSQGPGTWDSFCSGVVSSSGESEGGLSACCLSLLGVGNLRSGLPVFKDDETEARRGEGTHLSLRIQFQHFFHRHMWLCQAAHPCFGAQLVVLTRCNLFLFLSFSKRNGKLSRRTAVGAARNIRSSNFRSPSHAQPSFRPSAWMLGLYTWVPKSQLSHIPKGLSFHVLILDLFCK